MTVKTILQVRNIDERDDTPHRKHEEKEINTRVNYLMIEETHHGKKINRYSCDDAHEHDGKTNSQRFIGNVSGQESSQRERNLPEEKNNSGRAYIEFGKYKRANLWYNQSHSNKKKKEPEFIIIIWDEKFFQKLVLYRIQGIIYVFINFQNRAKLCNFQKIIYIGADGAECKAPVLLFNFFVDI